jgi:anti-anti-sigma regulatory factor
VLKAAKELTTMNSEIVLAVRASRLEGSSLTVLKDELRFLTQAGRNLTLDLSAVESVCANAASVLLAANTRLRKRGGSLQLTGVQPAAAAYFELLRVHRQLRMNTAAGAPVAVPMAA